MTAPTPTGRVRTRAPILPRSMLSSSALDTSAFFGVTPRSWALAAKTGSISGSLLAHWASACKACTAPTVLRSSKSGVRTVWSTRPSAGSPPAGHFARRRSASSRRLTEKSISSR